MLIDEGIWFQRLQDGTHRPGARALFLDRDGVLIKDRAYVHKPSDVQLIEGAAGLVAFANNLNLPVVVVTNQSGIASGLYGWEAFTAVNERMIAGLAERSARLDAILASGTARGGGHSWRKPQPGMLHAAAEALAIDLGRSWLVGDRFTDMRAARAAGLEGAIRVRHDRGGIRSRLGLNGFTLASVPSIMDAAPFLEPRGCDLSIRRAGL